jgi:hypothetical protein
VAADPLEGYQKNSGDAAEEILKSMCGYLFFLVSYLSFCFLATVATDAEK